MSETGESRRQTLRILGAVGLTCSFPFPSDELFAQTENHAAHALVQVQPAAPKAPRFFREADWKLITRLTDLIIPDTNTPGAAAAGVPSYIDLVVSGSSDQQRSMRSGLDWLENKARNTYGKPFLSLTEGEQIELLTPLSDAVDSGKATSEGDLFFANVKRLTADGYFTSKIGLMDTLSYKGNHVVGNFTGCTHDH